VHDFSEENATSPPFLPESRDSGERGVRVGDALETARGLSGPFDIVFNDVDKLAYPDVVPLALRLLRHGGCSSPTMRSGTEGSG